MYSYITINYLHVLFKCYLNGNKRDANNKAFTTSAPRFPMGPRLLFLVGYYYYGLFPIFRAPPFISETRSDQKERISDSDSTSKYT